MGRCREARPTRCGFSYAGPRQEPVRLILVLWASPGSMGRSSACIGTCVHRAHGISPNLGPRRGPQLPSPIMHCRGRKQRSAFDHRSATAFSGLKRSGRLRIAGLSAALAIALTVFIGIFWSPLGSRFTTTSGRPVTPAPRLPELTFPIRAAFYYPWFPEAWQQQGMNPFSHYKPSLGYYSTDATTVKAQIRAMQYANIDAGLASWWGVGSPTDQRVSMLLQEAGLSGFEWALYYEPEGQGDPTTAQITADLIYIHSHYSQEPGYLRVNGRPVLFVYADTGDDCAMSSRWKRANTLGFYIVLKVFSGYRTCADQPDGWHQYAPAGAEDLQSGFSFTISPAFWKASERTPRLGRDISRWSKSVLAMVASKEPWQLLTTFNEWGEGTSIESATEWQTSSGFGAYLDALHRIS